jgi:hypothetical protein
LVERVLAKHEVVGSKPITRSINSQRLHLCRSFLAIILSFVIQACILSGSVGTPMGPGSAPPMNPPFDAYDVCIRGINPVPVWEIWELTKMEASRQDCFKQTIQVNHLVLPAGTTAEQAFAKYKDCLKKDVPISVSVGPYMINGNKQNTARQNCFTSALQ